MKENKVKANKISKADNAFCLVLITFIIILAGEFAGTPFYLLFNLLKNVLPGSAEGFVDIGAQYFSTAGTWVAMILYCLVFKVNRPVLKTIWTKMKGNTLKFLLTGLAAGAAMNGACALCALLHGDIELSLWKKNPVYLAVLFIVVFIQSSSEELVFRGFLYQRLQRRYNNIYVTAAVTSVFFSAVHMLNPGFGILSLINIVVIGIFFIQIVYYFDSLWCAFAVHTAWNYTQNIIFGLPNSGQMSDYSLMKLNQDTDVDSIFYNTAFGVEGTLFADILLIAACVVLFLIGRKRKMNNSSCSSDVFER